MNDRTLSEVDRELAELADRSRALQVERARLWNQTAEANYRRTMRMLEALLCAHESRTRFVGCGGRAYWICDACEQVVSKAEPEPEPVASPHTVFVNVASPESIVQLLDSPGGEAAIMSVLRARGPRVPPRRCTAPNCGRLETEHDVRHRFTTARIEPAGHVAPPNQEDAPDAPDGIERIDKVALFALPEYSFSLPTGTTIGKRWRALRGNRWWIGEYVPSEKPGHVGIVWKVAELVEAPPSAAPSSQDGRTIADCVEKFSNAAPSFSAGLLGSCEHATYDHGFAKSGTIEPAPEPVPEPPPVGRSPDDMPF